MPRRAVFVLALGAIAIGCHDVVTVDPPKIERSHATLLVVVQHGDDSPALQARSLEAGPSIELAAERGSRLAMFFFDRSIDELFFDLLDQPEAERLRTRPIPEFDEGFQIRLGDESSWSPLATGARLPRPLAAIEIPAPDAATCIDRGGCYVTQADADANACTAPCPAIDPPRAPSPPAPVELSPCPEGWSDQLGDLGAPATCEPPMRTSCPAGQAQWAGSSTCSRLGSACTSGEWPDVSGVAAAKYVRASAPSGGDGSIAAPFRTIQEAILAGGAGATIALAKGVHAAGAVLPAGVRIRGACVEETTLESDVADAALAIAGAGVELRDVTVRSSTRAPAIDVADTDSTAAGLTWALAGSISAERGVVAGNEIGAHTTADLVRSDLAHVVFRDNKTNLVEGE